MLIHITGGMSSKIDIITEGYAHILDEAPISSGTKAESNNVGASKFMRATGSCCLVRSSGMKILFDTMGPWEQNLLLERLTGLNIHPTDIDYLICSHSHPDHIGNINLFTRARKHFIGTSVYREDIYDLTCFEPHGSYRYKTKRDIDVDVIQYKDYQIDNNLSIEPTQGHTLECISLVVDNCDIYGTVGLVGDLFERKEDVEDEGIWLSAGSQNPDLQRANRARIYNKVDYILPGHGPLFKVDRAEPVLF